MKRIKFWGREKWGRIPATDPIPSETDKQLADQLRAANMVRLWREAYPEIVAAMEKAAEEAKKPKLVMHISGDYGHQLSQLGVMLAEGGLEGRYFVTIVDSEAGVVSVEDAVVAAERLRCQFCETERRMVYGEDAGKTMVVGAGGMRRAVLDRLAVEYKYDSIDEELIKAVAQDVPESKPHLRTPMAQLRRNVLGKKGRW